MNNLERESILSRSPGPVSTHGATTPLNTPGSRSPPRLPVVTLALMGSVLAATSCGDEIGFDPPATFATWSLSEEPTLVIGGADERESHLLFQVAGAARLGDGRVVVANGSTLQLRYYDSAGNHLLDAGGRGEGPGELQPPLDHFTRLPGDSILVASFYSGFIRFGPDGRYASSIPYALPPRGRCWQFAGNDLLPDGSLLLRYLGTSRFTDTDEPCPELTVGRPPMVFGRYMPGTATGIDTIAVLPGFERTGDPNDLHAYSKDLVFGIAQDRLYLGDTGSDTILVIGFRGDTIATLPVPFEPAPVPADAKGKLFEDLTVSDREGSWTERMTFNYPDHYPRFARLVAAPGERVWVMAYPPLKEPAFFQELVHPVGRLRMARITAENRLTTYRAARSALSALEPHLLPSSRNNGKIA